MSDKFVKIGDPIGEDRPSVFELVIEDLVPFVDPENFGLKDVDSINPAAYFITSGDAVEKAKVLERDAWALAGKLRKQLLNMIEDEQECTHAEAQTKFRNGTIPSSSPLFADYESAVWKTAGNARKLLSALKKAKGEDCFLETEWNSHKLFCIPKNPRK